MAIIEQLQRMSNRAETRNAAQTIPLNESFIHNRFMNNKLSKKVAFRRNTAPRSENNVPLVMYQRKWKSILILLFIITCAFLICFYFLVHFPLKITAE